jgi:hypothetical protein
MPISFNYLRSFEQKPFAGFWGTASSSLKFLTRQSVHLICDWLAS